MAQFIPRWDLKADTNIITEGGTTYVRININRDKISDPSLYEIEDNQYFELTYRITGAGETLEERDFELSVGEDLNNLKPISESSTYRNMLGTHTVKLDTKSFELGNNLSKTAYYLKLYCVVDGVWDGPETLEFILDTMNIVTITEGQISNEEASGSIGTNTAKIAYNDSTEIWVTPSLTVRDEMYSICEMHYGSNSRAFVQAFGRCKPYSGPIVEDSSNRVFYPMYQMVNLAPSAIPSTNRTGHGTVLNPDPTATFPPSGEEMPVVIRDELGNNIETGLSLNGNGQLLGTFLYDSDPIDGYFRVKIVAPTAYYTTERDAFYIGKRFKAYQMWVCPQDTSYIKGSPTPGHLYQLKNTVIYPYVIKDFTENSIHYPIFEENDWIDLGYYDVSLGSGIIGQERTFRMIINGNTGDGISFITDTDLGSIHVGEYFGHTVYPSIQASGTLVTYKILESSRDDITKYNIDLTADGIMVGTAYAQSTDFSANDEIHLEFDVQATDKSGASVTATFKIRITRGFGQNFLSAFVKPHMPFERKWFKMISTSNFVNQEYYRTSDDRYGLQKFPKMLLKENFVSTAYMYESLQAMKNTLRDNLVKPDTGAPVPTGTFGFSLGNYKIRSALDSLGNVLYDVLYREIHPKGTSVPISMEPLKYTTQDNGFLAEFFGLRENIVSTVGEDTTNLLSDPTDLQNRGLYVDAITGISKEMLDTVPRYMNHPYTGDGVKAGFLPVIPVAYFKPGQAEAFFNTLIRSNEYQELVNEEFEITYVEFQYFFLQYAKYVQENYTVQIKEQSLLGG